MRTAISPGAVAAMDSWFTMFREEATWILAGFYASPLSWSNWNLECWFLWREKNPHESNKKLSPHMTPGRTRTQGPALAPLRDPCSPSTGCCKYSDYLMPSSDFLIQIKKLEIQEKENSWAYLVSCVGLRRRGKNMADFLGKTCFDLLLRSLLKDSQPLLR